MSIVLKATLRLFVTFFHMSKYKELEIRNKLVNKDLLGEIEEITTISSSKWNVEVFSYQ